MSLLIPSILALILTNQIIRNYGSDVNGIFVTVNQIANFFILIEGGFTLSANVALFKPYKDRDYQVVNSILSAMRKIFKIIGLVYAILTLVVAIFLPSIIESDVSSGIITSLMILTSLNTVYSFLFEYKYRILFQTSQKEYVISSINAASSLFGYSLAILITQLEMSITVVRLVILIIFVMKLPFVIFYHKKNYPFAKFKNNPDYSAIKGTYDVFIQKLSDMIFFNIPIILISIFSGSIFASVYAIYNSIFSLIRNVNYSFVMAPFNAFGQMINESGKNSIVKIFMMYQLIISIVSSILLTTTTILIIPFIELFTKGVNDVNYVDYNIATLFLIAAFLEISHVPSRGILNVSGNFKILKKIISFSTIFNLFVSIYLTWKYGIHGAIMGTILSYILMSPLVILITHLKYLDCGLRNFFRIYFPNVIVSLLIVWVFRIIDLNIAGYFDFVLKGSFLLLVISIFIVLNSYIFNKILFNNIILKFKLQFKK